MRRLESIEDQMRGIVTIEMDDGRRFTVAEKYYREIGLAGVARELNVPVEIRRLPVVWGGRRVGTLPSVFDPMAAKSRSVFFDLRPGDLKRKDDEWQAHQSLGPGDLSAIPGFIWDDDPARANRDVEEDRETVLRALAQGIEAATAGETA